jgi:predicted ATPase/class 3 adenylate cyclase
VLQDQLTAFEQPLPPAVRPQIFTQEEGENRLLTILFADLSGSTRATLALPPEDAATVLQGVLQAMVEAVVAHDGRINQVLGDAVLAFFGTPLAHENDPERAILAALQIREAVQERGLNVTVGINSGDVYLGELGRGPQQDIRAVGSAINLAARLQQAAQPGQILVGASVYGPTRRAFAFAEHAVEAKGFAGPVAAYEVLRPLPRAEKVRGIEGLHASLVGREEELGKLAGALEAVRAGQGQIVTLIGEAGVGKSRLIAELKDVALAPNVDQPEPLWLEGRCLDIGMAVTYWPFLDLLRAYVGFLPEEDERARGERVAAALRELVEQGTLAPERSREMLPLLGHLLAARLGSDMDERRQWADPEQLKHQIFLALRDLCVALSRRRPLVLVLEDLHWADSLSLDLVSLLMEALTLGPLLLLCVYRPEREHKCWHLGAIATRKCPERYTELTLRELTPAQSRRLVESLLHIEALPVSVKEQILARTQGNPFFVEEVVRSLLDADLVYHDGVAWRARAEITTVTVPESVQSVILSRVDRLDQQTKHVLQSASVIGRLFRRRLLERVARQEVALDRELAELEDRMLIYAERAIPEEEYSFQHVLTQETVYQSILRRQRVVFHRQVAGALEGLYGESLEEHYEQLAYHYEQAGVQEKVLEYLERAGDKAQAQYANAVAEGYYRDLVERLDRLGRLLDGARAREKLGAVLHLQSRFVETLEILDRAAEIYRAAGDPESLGRVVEQIGFTHSPLGTYEQGIARLQGELNALEAHGSTRVQAGLHHALAELYMMCTHWEAGLRQADMAVELARAAGDKRILRGALNLRGQGLAPFGRWDEALSDLEQAIELMEAANDRAAVVWVLQEVARIHFHRGAFEACHQAIERAVQMAEEVGNPTQLVAMLGSRGLMAYYRGDWASAHADLARALATGRQIERSVIPTFLPLMLARLRLGEGDWEAAFRLMDEGRALAEDVGWTWAQEEAQGLLAERDVLEGRPAEARRRLRPLRERLTWEEISAQGLRTLLALAELDLGNLQDAAREAAEAVGHGRAFRSSLELMEGLRVQALIALRQSRWDVAAEVLEESLGLARGMPYPYGEARLLQVYGQMHLQQGEPELARERLEAALAAFQRLGARKDAERAAQAMADVAPRA